MRGRGGTRADGHDEEQDGDGEREPGRPSGEGEEELLELGAVSASRAAVVLLPGTGAALGCFRTVAAAIDIPIMVQDAPLSSTRLSAAQLAALARDFITRSVRPGR